MRGRALGEAAGRAKVTQNIDDDPALFAGYGRLARSIEGSSAPEWPAPTASLSSPAKEVLS